MSASPPPADGGEKKPDMKAAEGNNNANHHKKNNFQNNNRNFNKSYPKKERFQGSHSDLVGCVFSAGSSISAQAHQFRQTDLRIKAYIGQKYDPHVLESIEKGMLTLPPEPVLEVEDDGTVTKQSEIIFGKKYDRWLSLQYNVGKELKQAYSIYYGQCDPDIQSKLAESSDFKTIHDSKDVLGLYRILQTVNFTYTNNEEPIMAMWKVISEFIKVRQQKGQTISEYYERFKSMCAVNETVNTSVYDHLGFTAIIAREKGVDLDSLTEDERNEFGANAMIEGRDRMMAIHFLLGADQEVYGGLPQNLKNLYLMNNKNEYPKDLTAAYTLLKGWASGKAGRHANQPLGVAFTVDGEETEGSVLNTNGSTRPTCTRCGRSGHKTKECFAKTKVDGTVLHIEGITSVEELNEQVSTNVMFGEIGNDLHELMFCNDGDASRKSSTISSSGIPTSWILLDSQSTVDIFSNADLLSHIHPTKTIMRIKCNAGTKSTNLRGFLSGYGWVWYFPAGIANILSLSRVKERFRVTFDSAIDNAFHVHKEDKVLKFREAARRLYYLDTAERDNEATLLVTTVDDNMSKYSSYDVSRARLARSVQKRLGRPSTQDYIRYVRMNLIPNCPVTVQDIKNAEFIWGPDLGSLKGKTVRRKSPVVQVKTSNIPLSIMEKYRNVTLSIDVMKVNKIPFLMTISQHIKFGSAGRLDDEKDDTILKHVKFIMGVYTIRGFRVTIILADNQFESMRGGFADLGAIVNVVSRDEHVPEVERYNRTIKDRVRSEYNVQPFDYVPPVMTVEMVYTQVFWRNMFALKGGVSQTQSPAEIILNRKLDFNAHCRVEFGEYVQTHEEHDNSMGPRTVGAIATRPTGNAQGGYYFIRLDTGRRITRKDWTSLPMPDLVKDQVHRLARRAKANKQLTFTNMRNEDLDELYAGITGIDEDDTDNDAAGVGDDAADANSDSDDDSNYYAPLDEDSEDSDDESSDEDDGSSDEDDGTNNDDDDEIPGVDNNAETPGVDAEGDDVENTGVGDDAPTTVDSEAVETTGVDDNEDVNDGNEESENQNDNETERTYAGMSLRSQQRKEYDVDLLLLQFDENGDVAETTLDADDDARDDAHYLFLTETLGWKAGLEEVGRETEQVTSPNRDGVNAIATYLFLTEQMSWKKGLKVFEEKGEEAIMKELKQIHDIEGFVPKHWYELTEKERKAALKYLMYLKEKRDGRIKGRGCADGRPQRVYTDKSDSTSPTVSLGGLIMTCVIDAYERRDVATADIPGAFLQTKQPKGDVVHVVLDGRMAELLAKISPATYQEYVYHKRGQAYIYCQLDCALYGTLKAAMLFWRKLTKTLLGWGFTVNPYDWCVVNKDIDGSQCTIVWHVDDLKISHKKSTVVDNVIKDLKKEFEKIGEMSVTRGKVHTYLGMKMDFSKPGKFIIDMQPYLDDIFEDLKDIEMFRGEATTPAADHLFKTRQDAEKLSEDEASLFHRTVAQLLWVKQRGRPDFSVAVAFLCTRVKQPDIDDMKKLARLIKYARRTKFLRLTMEASHLDQNHWLIDGAFAVHDDMKSHTGSFMTFGRGMMAGSSSKQKINTTSSTEAEVVAVHDNMPSILWTKYFLEAQGYKMKPSVIHQDNQSAMLLETNGRGSSSKRTRHMNIRYFFVADVQARNQVVITYCPTDEMIGDFFTKPLGGAKFRRMRNIILNCDVDEYGPVDVDELTRAHYARIDKIYDGKDMRETNLGTVIRGEDLEPTVDKQLVGSQECVGHKMNGSVTKLVGGSHKRPLTRSHPSNDGRTWARIVAE